MDTNTTSIRFNYKLENNKDQPYFQVLFYIGSNLSQYIANKNHNVKSYNTDMYDNKFDFTDDNNELNIEISQFNSEDNIINENSEFNITYLLNRFTDKFSFKFEGKKFIFIKVENCKNTLLIERGTITDLYSSFEIKINQCDMEIFESFVKQSILYFNKFYNGYTKNKSGKHIKIFISNPDGYFESIGKRYKRSLDTIYLPSKQKNAIVDDITKFLKDETRQRYMKLGINYKKTYLFEGVPGSGKSSFIMALASHFNYNLAIISFHPKMTDNDLMRIIRSIDSNNEDIQSFIVFEDMDCIFKERKSNDENKNLITFSGLLNVLDGITTPDNQICFITTNYKQNLDSALIRPGRVDYIMKFDYAIKEQIIEIFNVYTNTKDKATEFYSELCKYNIKISTSLLQQYLLTYLDDAKGAIANLDALKKMYDACNISKEAEDTGMFQ